MTPWGSSRRVTSWAGYPSEGNKKRASRARTNLHHEALILANMRLDGLPCLTHSTPSAPGQSLFTNREYCSGPYNPGLFN